MHRLDRLRNLRYHHKLVLSVLIVFGILVLIVLVARDRETLQIVSEYGAQDPRFPDYVAALAGAQTTSGNTFDILENGDRFFPPMLADIDGARTLVDLETYIYEKGAVADQFTAALVAAARRGVTVNLVIDALGSKKMPREAWDRLRDAGVHLGDYGTPTWYKLQQINYRTHRKVLVVDGRVAFVGGAGVADHWLGDAQDPAHWRDMMVRIEGPIVRLLEGAFNANFVSTVRPVTPIVAPVRAAGYFLIDQSSRWAFAQAAARGVRIRILVEGDQTDARIVKFASRAAYDNLMAEGIQIYEYQPTMMHAKAMIVDGAWSMFGSANFDNRSLELNDELNVVAVDRPLAERLTREFEHDLRSAKRLDRDEWRHRSPLEKAREHFWSYFGEVF